MMGAWGQRRSALTARLLAGRLLVDKREETCHARRLWSPGKSAAWVHNGTCCPSIP